MIRRSRAVVALLLLLTLPLRAMAALAMPCCPMEDRGEQTSMAMPADDGSVEVAAATTADHAVDRAADHATHSSDGATPSHASFDCCTFAMMVPPALHLATSPYAPPFATPLSARPDVAFVTDAPERPPRPATPPV